MKTSRLLLPIVLGAASLVVLSCRDPLPLGTGASDLVGGATVTDSTSSPPTAPIDSLVHLNGLLRCTPQPADSATQVIGPLGGTITAGANTFTVPAGALLTPVSITMVAASDTVNRVHFEPEGLQFLQPASLTMSYANCDTFGSLIPKNIAFTTDLLAILEILKSWDDHSAQTVTGQVNHFSEYAVAW